MFIMVAPPLVIMLRTRSQGMTRSLEGKRPASARPRRSVLYMPGTNSRALEKARSLAADALIFDLEDAVAPDAKATARGSVASAVASGGYGKRELLLRVNALGTPWGEEDLAAAAHMAIDGVVLPKVESPETIRAAEAVLVDKGAGEGLAIWCMMETPLGILRAGDIAAASRRLGGRLMGESDPRQCPHSHPPPRRPPPLT